MSENSERADRISRGLKPRGGPVDREGDHNSSPIDKGDYDRVMADRPEKFDAGQVGYRKAPRGSEQRCENCLHFYTRQLDKFGVCEIFRSAETDEKGVDPKWMCNWWTSDGENHPLAPS